MPAIKILDTLPERKAASALGLVAGALRRAHHSQRRLKEGDFIPSYQCTRDYSCWGPGSLAATGLADGDRRDLHTESLLGRCPLELEACHHVTTAPGCHSLSTLLSLEHNPFVGLGGLPITSLCHRMTPSELMSPGVCRGSLDLPIPASLSPLAPSQLAFPVCLAVGHPGSPYQPPVPDLSPGCCPSLGAALLSLPRTPAAGRGRKENKRRALLLAKWDSLCFCEGRGISYYLPEHERPLPLKECLHNNSFLRITGQTLDTGTWKPAAL